MIKKRERRLYLVKKDKPFRTYSISLGFSPDGHKQHQGDGRTPEGRYYIDWRNPGSKFRKSLHVSYPNYKDKLHARTNLVTLIIWGLWWPAMVWFAMLFGRLSRDPDWLRSIAKVDPENVEAVTARMIAQRNLGMLPKVLVW